MVHLSNRERTVLYALHRLGPSTPEQVAFHLALPGLTAPVVVGVLHSLVCAGFVRMTGYRTYGRVG